MLLSLKDTLINNKVLLIVISVVVLFATLAIMWTVKAVMNKKKGIKYKVSTVAEIGIFTALSMVLYFFPKFSIPGFPSFLEVNFSLLPIIMLGFMSGPFEGITAVFMRAIIKLPFSSTFCVGEIADLIIGFAVVLSSSLMYTKFHTKKGAFASLSVGMGAWVVASAVSNYFVNLPFFMMMYGKEPVMGMLQVIPGLNETNYMWKYILFAVIPFNLIVSVAVNLITFLVYKKISCLFHKMDKKKDLNCECDECKVEENQEKSEIIKEN